MKNYSCQDKTHRVSIKRHFPWLFTRYVYYYRGRRLSLYRHLSKDLAMFNVDYYNNRLDSNFERWDVILKDKMV